jgi:hypothetical protein
MATPESHRGFDWEPHKVTGFADEDFRAPDLIGTVEGWRAWRLAIEVPPFGNCPKLNSASFGYYWAPRQRARAECRVDPAHVPGEQCSCGFYAAKTLKHLRSMGYHAYAEGSPYITCVGRLAMWGKVIEGSQGWRGEYAYPVTLYLPFEGWKLGKPLREGYGVPVRLLNILDPTKSPNDLLAEASEAKEL